jgi:hypothetical protein
MSPFSPAVKKGIEERLKEIMAAGFTAEYLYDELNRGSQLSFADLKVLLDEKVADRIFTVSAGPAPRYKLADTAVG